MKFILVFALLGLNSLVSFADVYSDIDNYFAGVELYKTRLLPQGVDQCHIGDSTSQEGNTFASQLEAFISWNMKADQSELDYIAPIYGIIHQHPVSLVSHRMCSVTSESLAKTLKLAERVPATETIAKINHFVDRYNTLRAENNVEVLKQQWGRLFGCLSYIESLSSADTPKAYELAREFGPPGYEKPEGVNFYLDKSSNQEGGRYLTVGLYQFHPKTRGNVLACVQRWNKNVSEECKLNERGEFQDTLLALASPFQSFNAFCGIDKVLESFYVQINTEHTHRTHPENLLQDQLKSPQDRCVSLHFFGAYTYNHFGPLQNTIANNLTKLMHCVVPDQI